MVPSARLELALCLLLRQVCIPFHHEGLVLAAGFEPAISRVKTGGLGPLGDASLVLGTGFEPVVSCLRNRGLSGWLTELIGAIVGSRTRFSGFTGQRGNSYTTTAMVPLQGFEPWIRA
jgi:hypothetical protein